MSYVRFSHLLIFAGLALASSLANAQDSNASNSAAGNQVRSLPPVTRNEVAPELTLKLPERPLVIQTQGGGAPAWSPALITALGSLAASLIALFTALAAVRKGNKQSAENTRQSIEMTERNTQAAVNQRSNELEIATIEERLSKFFGPFMQLSEENKRLAGLLRNRQPDADFRTLKALLDPAWKNAASPTDLNLVGQIVANGVKLRTLIRESAGPVSWVLMPYLSRASAHFTILELAHEGQLTEQTDDFVAYVYPRQLDKVLELECDRLVKRRDALRSGLSTRHAAAPDLTIPTEFALDEGTAKPASEGTGEASALSAAKATPKVTATPRKRRSTKP